VPVVQIGGDGPAVQHEDPFKEAASRIGQRASVVGHAVFLANSMRPRPRPGRGRLDRRGGAVPEPPRTLQRLRAEYERAVRDLPYVERFLWGGQGLDGRPQPGVGLDGAYQAWLRAAGQVDADPFGARVMMQMCRQRAAACPGGPSLLRTYDEHLYQGVPPVEAMRQAWSETEPARTAAPTGRPHGAAPRRPGLHPPEAAPAHLPVATGASRAPAEVDPRTAAVEAAQLLGTVEVTLPQLREFQLRYGTTAARDGQTLARQWLADAHRQGAIGREQHDAWSKLTDQIRHSREHQQWRTEHGLDPASTRAPAARDADRAGTDPAQPGGAHQPVDVTDHQRGEGTRPGATAGTPAAGTPVAGTPPVGTPAVGTPVGGSSAEPTRPASAGPSSTIDRTGTPPTRDPGAGLRSRAAAARPSPAAITRAAPPADLAGKRQAPVIAAQPIPPRTPGRS
jgi:hypothetical protein